MALKYCGHISLCPQFCPNKQMAITIDLPEIINSFSVDLRHLFLEWVFSISRLSERPPRNVTGLVAGDYAVHTNRWLSLTSATTTTNSVPHEITSAPSGRNFDPKPLYLGIPHDFVFIAGFNLLDRGLGQFLLHHITP
tara:strand:- start:3061 stop:3474 length:414 start_codon:yes stop_codon:yes gene_type:complete